MRVWLVLGILLFASTAQAADEVPVEAESRMLVVDGVQGRWFPMPKLERLLGDVRAVALYKERIALLEERLTVGDAVEVKLTKLKDLAEQSEAILSDELDHQVARADKLQEKLDAWYRSPALWFGAGVVVTTAAIIAGAFVAR